MDETSMVGSRVAGYKKLNAWVKASELAFLIYKLTKKFPRDEMFGLISQMRRCAVSVPANIVEGYGRRTSKDKLRFYYIARGSLTELEFYLDFSHQLGYLNVEDYRLAIDAREVAGNLLGGFMKSIAV